MWAMRGNLRQKKRGKMWQGRCQRQRGRRDTKSGCGAQFGQQRKNQVRRRERMVYDLGVRTWLFQRSNCAGKSRETEFNFNREQ